MPTMRMSFSIRALANVFLCSVFFTSTSAVLYGDEQFGDDDGGRFWAFHSAGISVVNPETCLVEHSFTQDQEGNSFPDAWSDGIYMRPSDGHLERARHLGHDPSTPGFVLINSGITKFDGHENLEGGAGEVLAFSTDPKRYATGDVLESRVIVGGRPGK